MKRIIAAMLALLVLCGCASAELSLDSQGLLHALFGTGDVQAVVYEGTSYLSGFYGENCGFAPEMLVEYDAYPSGASDQHSWFVGFMEKIEGLAVEIDGRQYYRVDNGRFPMLFSLDSVSFGVLQGTLCCAEDHLEEARAYYADGANYDYYCRIGTWTEEQNPESRPIPDMDAAKFEQLMAFAEENAYDPFGKDMGDTLPRIPMPAQDEAPELVFYRESRDNCTVSHCGYTFHIIDGRLLLVYYYDFGHGEYEEIVYAEVPADLGGYFVNLLKNS